MSTGLRDTVSGVVPSGQPAVPATTVTITATMLHAAASDHEYRVASTPEDIGEKKPPPMVFIAAWNTIVSSTLASALLNSQA